LTGIGPKDLQHIVGKINYPEKVQDVMDKNSLNKSAFIAKEFTEQNLNNLSLVVNIENAKMPIIEAKKKKEILRKLKSRRKSIRKRKISVIEEDAGRIIDTEG